MAIVVNQETVEELRITINNGDLEALRAVLEKYHFNNTESSIRFALAVLLRAENNGVYIDENDNKVFVQPSEKLLRPRADKVIETPSTDESPST